MLEVLRYVLWTSLAVSALMFAVLLTAGGINAIRYPAAWADLEAAEREIVALRRGMVEVLEVTIARGERLGYHDTGYRSRYRALSGSDYL